MGRRSDVQALANGQVSRSKMDRREMVRRLMLGAGTGFALPAVAASHPIAKHLADPAAFSEADAQAAAAIWSPKFLDPHQNETLIVLAERIIPGSSQANVNRFIDLLVSVDTQEAQKKFLASLGAFEAQALDHFSRPYKDLTEAQQNQILTAASTAKSGKAPDATEDSVPVEEATLRDHFENLKGWVSGAYYSSEVGMKSLGWTRQVVFESFPGCRHPGGHQ